MKARLGLQLVHFTGINLFLLLLLTILISKTIFVPYTSNYSLRHSAQMLFMVPFVFKEVGINAFMFQAPSDWKKFIISLI